jgi:endonuclease/exonuclease/phosphatase family metal-dependent hydrolase
VPSFSLLTLNCFGVPTPTTRRRLLAIAQELNRGDYSLACLQEVQASGYVGLLTEACATYPHSAFEPFIYAPKGGLLTLSRLPIEERAFALYRERTIVSPPAVMDWALHKGVLLARVSLAGVPIVVLSTHLSANYSASWGPGSAYARVQRLQLQQLAEIVRGQPASAIVVACGDFNIPRGGQLYDEFLAASGMVDPLAGDMRPTQRMPPGIPARFALPIDFALLRSPPLPGLRLQSDHRLAERLPIAGARADYLSDHVGIELRVTWEDLPAGG